MIRRNPLFDYTAFKEKRNQYVQYVTEYIEEDQDEDVARKLANLLQECQPTLDFLTYATPFAVEVLADCFLKTSSDSSHNYEEAVMLAEYILKVSHEEQTRVIEWFADQISDLYSYQMNIQDFLNRLVNEYNRQVTDEYRFEFAFPSTAVEFGDLKDDFIENVYRSMGSGESELGLNLGGVRFSTENGFLGMLSCYFFKGYYLDDDARHKLQGALLYVVDKANDSDQHLGLFTDLGDEINLPRPFWMSSCVTNVDFFTIGTHFTSTTFEDSVTPLNLRTKLVDYRRAHFATHGRDLPTTNREESSRALVFCWAAEDLAEYRYLKFDKHREPSSYGKNIIYMFTNGLVSFYKFGDADLQSVALLNQIVETLPIYAHDTISMYKDDVYAYFGLSEERDMPLYEVDFRDWKHEKTPFESFILDSILKYLASSEYSPNHNINQTITERQFKKLNTQRRI